MGTVQRWNVLWLDCIVAARVSLWWNLFAALPIAATHYRIPAQQNSIGGANPCKVLIPAFA
ncbi:hypothetical protein RRSWK_04674 [Rhodopirellula sp. SWK7]|nr:hypothetical protein RRSWK_04674 [Rhodopirellula sp. SWK7]